MRFNGKKWQVLESNPSNLDNGTNRYVILKFINHHLGLLQSKKNDLRRNRTRGGRQPGRARAGSPACANKGPRPVPSAENKNESL